MDMNGLQDLTGEISLTIFELLQYFFFSIIDIIDVSNNNLHPYSWAISSLYLTSTTSGCGSGSLSLFIISLHVNWKRDIKWSM